MKATGGKLMYETLRNYGVTHLFGMDEPVHLTQELEPGVMKMVLVRDEKHGAIMAHGFAKVTNKPGICTALHGIAACNLIPGLAESLKASVPVIALVVDVKTTVRGKNASHEIDQEALLKPVTKWVERIDNTDRVPEMVRKAFRIATSGRPGPVALICPFDIMAAQGEAEVYAEPDCDRYPSRTTCANHDAIVDAINLLTRAKRPVIIAGGGCLLSQAWDPVLELAETYRIPIATTLMGKGLVPDSHPLSIGVMGTYTGGKFGKGQIANQIVAEADLAIIMGSRTDQVPYDDWNIPTKGTSIIHLDIDPEEIGRNFETRVALVGDVKTTLNELIRTCKSNNANFNFETDENIIASRKTELFLQTEPLRLSTQAPLRPEAVCHELCANLIDENTIVAMDASFVCEWVLSYIDTLAIGAHFLMGRAMSGIGWDLPAAIGAKFGCPDKTVVSICGDGAFGYVMNELETASRNNIKVIEIIFNNASFGFQKHYEELLFGRSVETDLQDIDYSEVARALKCQGERVTDHADLKKAFIRAKEADGPYLIDVVIDPSATPPISWFDGFEPQK
ncbi:MAG: thiamine pyrophosphate-binding protein [Rhodospirillales bacterium]|nr:thiamine pyrophosphate-binding protein [Rhodospirillales bacterium]